MEEEARLGPDDLVGRRFPMVLRGYDRQEVDEFLSRAATAWRASMASLAIVAPRTAATSANGPAGPVTFGPSVRPVEPAAADPVAAAPPVDTSVATARGEARDDEVVEHASSNGAGPAGGGAALDAPDAGATTLDGATRAEIARDRTAAFAERKAAELDRATARIELARAQEEALRIVDVAQRRAESVLVGTRDRARIAAESVLAEARARLGPLVEQEKLTRVSLSRLSKDIGVVADTGAESEASSLPDPADLVIEAEEDPDTPPSPFPIDLGPEPEPEPGD